MMSVKMFPVAIFFMSCGLSLGSVKDLAEHAADLVSSSRYFRAIAGSQRCPGLSDETVGAHAVGFKLVNRCDGESVSMLVGTVWVDLRTGDIADGLTDASVVTAPDEAERLRTTAQAFLLPEGVARSAVSESAGIYESTETYCSVREPQITGDEAMFEIAVMCRGVVSEVFQVNRLTGRIESKRGRRSGLRRSSILEQWREIRLGPRLTNGEVTEISAAHTAAGSCKALRAPSLDIGTLRAFDSDSCRRVGYAYFLISEKNGSVYDGKSLEKIASGADTVIVRTHAAAEKRHRVIVEKFANLLTIR